MALTASVKYGGKLIALPSGQVVTLPGSDIFSMPNSVPSAIDIYTIGTTQRFPLGMKIEIGDDTYRYVEFGGTTAAGDMVQAEAPDAAHDDLNPTGTGSGAGVAVGETIISTSNTITLVQDEYAGGYVVIENDTGQGYKYHIESNDDVASNALFRIKLGLAVAIDSTSDTKLVKARWKEVIQAPTALTAVIVGASVGVGADGSFGFVQTKGVAAVLTDGTVVIGAGVMPSNATAGSVEAWGLTEAAPPTEIHPRVGYVVDVGPTTEYSLIYLQLDN